jgi:hypothetical protein
MTRFVHKGAAAPVLILTAGALCLALIPLSALFAPIAVAQNPITTSTTRTASSGNTGTGAIKGVGSAGYIPKFFDAYTIGTSGLYDNLGNIGIGTTNPQAKLDVLGNIHMSGIGSALIFPDLSVVHNRAELIGPQGPQGLPGPTGPTGATGLTGSAGQNGISHGYFVSRKLDPIGLTGQDVVALNLPAGTFLLFAKVDLHNLNPFISTSCTIGLSSSLGATLITFVFSGTGPDGYSLPVLDSVSLAAPDTYTVSCQGAGNALATLSAIQVNQLN